MNALSLRQRAFWIVLMALASVAAAQRQAPEPDLKAAILVNMLLFIEWPSQTAQSRDRRLLCYLDASPVATALARLDGRTINGRPLSVQPVPPAEFTRLAACHALYLAPGDMNAIATNLPALVMSSVLVMGDSPDYLERGAMLNLDVDAGRVVFDIDLKVARQAGLVVSSKVLRLARHVVE